MFRPNSRVIATIVAATVSGAVMATMAPAGASAPVAPAEIDIWGAMASTSDQLDQLSQDVVAAQEALRQAEGQLPGAQAEFNAATDAAAAAAAADADAAASLAQAEEAVRSTKAQIEDTKAKIDGLKSEVNSFARDVYTSGSGQLAEMGVVLGSQNPADFTAGLESINKVSRGKNEAVADYTQAKQELDDSLAKLQTLESLAEQRRQEAASALASAQESAARASAAKSNVETLVDQRSTAITVIEGQRQEVKAQYDGLAAAQAQIEQLLRDREAERQRVLAAQAQQALAEKAAQEKAAQEQAAAAQAAQQQAAAAAEAAAAAAQQEAERQAAEVAARTAQEQAAAQAAAAAAQAAQEQAAVAAKAAAEQAAAQEAAAAAQSAAEQAAAEQAAAAAAQAAAQQQAAAQAAADQAAAQQAAAAAALEEAVVEQWRSQAAAAQAAAEAAAQAAQAAAEQAAANLPSVATDPAPTTPAPTTPVTDPGGGGTTTGGGWVWPVSGGFNSSPPGPRQHPTYGYWACHKGEDISASSGTPIVATHSGTVISAGWNSGGYGNMTLIDHGDGTSSLYAHQDSIIVFAGQSVTAGQLIGYVGSTGDSTGPHLHFEVHVGGVAYLPQGWFGGSYGPVPC